ncbi:S-layer homology domain-containing protein [Collinsella tanakaei]|uniref:S-layer homology domain-containing protein n=1 Tax=Collinsella tanakaei TaxID=626935 RepID=UPI00195ABC4C|nr:S-layer homology domain-containing protein [Collinsella tanakaei]MBM6868175.1 S-layer homology domain-containing protein [Collinsella tanakaei]
MTACVNRKHTKKVAAVVTASLVGALSLGVAPVAAMATDEGISTQSVSEQEAWANGTITYAHDNQGYIISDPSNIEFEAGSGSEYPMVLEVTPKNGKAVRVSQRNVKYFTSAGRQITNPNRYNWGIGTYKMEISAPATSEYRGGVLEVEFKIVAKSLEGVQLFNSATGDVSNSTFTYNGEPQLVNFYIDGKILQPTDVNVVFYKAGSDSPLVSADGSNIPIDAGDYVAVLTGTGDYAGSEVQLPFTVNKLDITNAEVSVTDVTTVPVNDWLPTDATIDGMDVNTTDDVDITFVSAENGDHVIKNKTVYTVKVAANSLKNPNLTGSKEATFSIVDILIKDADIKYDGVALDGQTVNVNLKKVGTYFDVDKITALFGDLSIVITNAAGEVVDANTVNDVPGDYTVTVRVDAKANQFKYGSDTVSMTVKTRNGDINADANAYFTLDGTVVDHVEPVTYDGENVLDRIGTVVEHEGENLTAGEDYTVTVKNSLGQTVDSIVDAGVYHVIISSDLYNLTGDCELTVVVKPIALTKVYIGSDAEKAFGNEAFIPYTGEAASYYFYVLDKDGNEVRLPEGTIELDHFYFTAEGESKAVDTDEIVEQGVYKASIKIAAGVKNYVFLGEEAENTLKVDDAKVFSDVPTTYWAAENIYKADALGYMNGYNGTTFFGPLDNIKRGDVVVTLYKMAGQPSPSWLEDYKSETDGYVTGFDDVDSSMYYAKAIAWAKAVGITSGDAGTNNFRPEDNISRQELAKMLCVYAEKTGKDVEVDADEVLAKYDDADTVAPWAEEYVAWAAEAGIMGQDSPLRASDPINRAEVATMAVRLQPKPLEGSEDLIPRP